MVQTIIIIMLDIKVIGEHMKVNSLMESQPIMVDSFYPLVYLSLGTNLTHILGMESLNQEIKV